MNNATLTYVINGGTNSLRLLLENENLFNVDKYTSRFKDENDFLNHYYYRDKINSFIKENGKKGKLVVSYNDLNEKKDLMPLYNSSGYFVFRDDPALGKITEVEKARRLLFNSKNQLFTRLIMNSSVLQNFFNNIIDLTDEEKKYLDTLGIETTLIDNVYYVSFESLLKYRLENDNLGLLRSVYEDMIDSVKKDIMSFDNNSFYFYNRELRILIDKYYYLTDYSCVNNLNVRKIKKNNRFNLIKHSFYYM